MLQRALLAYSTHGCAGRAGVCKNFVAFYARRSSNINDPDRHTDAGRATADEVRRAKAAGAVQRYRESQHAVGQAPALEDDLGQVPGVIIGSTAMESIIEKQIQASVDRGEFLKLKGAGQPLPHRHEDQFARVDPLVSALTRAMGAQNIKPPSIEFRDEMARARAAFTSACRAAAAKGAAHRANVLAGQDAGVSHLFEELQKATKAYNDACLSDKENYGWAWPLNPVPKLVYDKEVAEALADGNNN